MKKVMLGALGLACLMVGTLALAQQTGQQGGGTGAGQVAATAISNLANIARLITATSYVAGMAFVVGAIVKFKAHKDNPTQIPIGTPIALLFVGAALIFIPTVFRVAGGTIFVSGQTGGPSGVATFMSK